MTFDDPLTAGASPEAVSAQTLGTWLTTLAEDASCVAEVSQQLPPGSPVRAPLRAGLRHLLHIERLARGIEGLAMLEVSIMLRVTALLASAPEDLDNETVLRLRADTPLIEELFPEEREVIWQFCQALIDKERGLPNEQPLAAGEAAPLEAAPPNVEMAAAPRDENPAAAERDPAAVAFARAKGDESPKAGEQPFDAEADLAPSSPSDAEHATEPTATFEPDRDATRRPLTDEPAATPDVDELVERIRTWAATYRAPAFGTKPHDLTRARAFVRTRVAAWAGV